jgi:hypothetical protein
MPNWDALADLDVEILIRDLLSAEWNLHVESFRRGPDEGIDLRAAGPSGPPLNLKPADQIVVQVKHYPNATSSRLRSVFAKEAQRNIIGPGIRYIPATTAKLSPKTKRQISEIFQPHVRQTDVIGRDDLESLLARHPAVERRHLRLWLTDTATLEAVLHARQRLLQNQVLQEMRQQASLLVSTRHLKLAEAILESEGAVILAGPPGVGKTSAALLLLATQIKSGWEILAAVDNLSEVEAVRSSTNKQVIYYDDFLGSSLHTAFLSGKNEDRRIVGLLEQAKLDPNLRLILTTREYVLAAARKVHPRLGDDHLDFARVLVDASDLDVFERSEILYRHIYFSTCRPILEDHTNSPNLWLPVLTHPAFNPRLAKMFVAALSRQSGHRHVPTAIEFTSELVSALNDPGELWRNIYDDHLSRSQQQLLETCATLPVSIALSDLLTLTSYWTENETNDPQLDARRRADLRVLDGDFLSVTTLTIGNVTDSLISFANTSIASYVLLRLSTDAETVLKLVEHAAIFEQVEQLWRLSERYSYSAEGSSWAGRTFEVEYTAEREQEIFDDAPGAGISEADSVRFRHAFRDAIIRTYETGRYDWHPSLGVMPKRWLRTPAPLARRLPIIHRIAEVLNLGDDRELANSVIDPFINYVARGRGEAEGVLNAIESIFSSNLSSWSRRKADIRPVADEYFLSDFIDGQDFLDAIEYLFIVGKEQLLSKIRPKLITAIMRYASTEEAMYRLSSPMHGELDLVIGEFNEAAEIMGITVSMQLAELRIALRKIAESIAEARSYNYSRPRSNYESIPAKAERGDVSRSAAREAARLLCPGGER